MTEDNPEPLGTLMFRDVTIQMYDDGEHVRLADGSADCSEHGDLVYNVAAEAHCDHNPPGDDPAFEPVFDMADFVGAAAQDPRVQDAVLKQVGESDPEKLADAAEPLFQ